MEPIIILAFDEETERGIPVTNEDVERGSLEEGWSSQCIVGTR